MRLYTLLIALLLWAGKGLAQMPPPEAPVADSTMIPNFTIVLADGRHVTKGDLDPHKPVMIVYYSPTCEHCQHFGQDLAAHIGEFKGAQIVMVTFRPLNEVKDFENICHLEHSGVYVGSEGLTWVVQHHYNITNFPFVAVYNKDWKLKGVYRNPPIHLSLLRRGLFGKTSRNVE
ncbi:TlpA family protein disulfide reductase [Dinghuibacter silviterrae]|uniref:AhpC/TSA family protein n=1 Tax=Dinghuibacter silviterrae TaxID=1539049 RepID=A0A4R8DR10_9BACT|nr:redoxin domain-containing protein [Dinghuibacter silviterrae]TDX00602.1 AhpC/TSA family protein [Dinghuibacter silviterrae]